MLLSPEFCGFKSKTSLNPGLYTEGAKVPMYMSAYYIQTIVPKNVHEIMQKCALQTAGLLLPLTVVMSMIH